MPGMHAADSVQRLCVVRPARGEALLQRGAGAIVHPVLAAGLERLHPLLHLRIVPTAQLKEQALEVGGHQDVHRGRGGLVEGAVGVVDALLDEVEQHVVGVAGAQQPAHGQAHALGVVGGQYVAEVAGGHAEVDLLPHRDRALLDQIGVRGEVVGDLRHEASPVDGIGAGERIALLRQLPGKLLVAKDALDARLRVVKVALYGADVDVIAFLRDHLQLLRGGDAVHGVEHAHLRALDVAEALQRGLAGVAGGGHEDEHLLVHAGLFHGAGHQAGQHLQRHVLKGVGGAVPQLQHVQIANALERRGIVAKARSRIGARHALVDLLPSVVGQVRAQDLPGAGGIGHARHAFDADGRKGRKVLRHVKTTFVGEPRDDGLCRIHLSRLIARRHILHGRKFLFLT